MIDTKLRLFHISDQPGIEVFEPRTGGHGFEDEAVVWAIDHERLPNYLFPRDCPRVTFYAREDSDPADIDRLMYGTSAKCVVAVESLWLPQILKERIYQYEFAPDGFTMVDDIAGYHISRQPAKPISEIEITDLLAELLNHGVEFRVMPSLWKLRDAVINSTLGFSIIRFRNAQPPD